MARDSRVRMRDGLVIPGVLLTFYGIVAIIYAEQVRATSDFCPDSNRVLIAGLCYSVWKIILPLVLIGIGLIITGLVAFRGEPEELEGHLHHGTAAHTGMALLISLIVVPLSAWFVQTIRQDVLGGTFELNILGARYEHTFLLELIMVAAALVFIPFLSLYVAGNVKRRRFIVAATEVLERPGDDALPHERGFHYADSIPAREAQSAPMVPDEDWPDDREPKDPGPPPTSPPAPPETTTSPAPEQPDPSDAPRAPPFEEQVPTAEEEPAPDFVPCQGSDGGLDCPNPAQEGLNYCPAHACQGRTRVGGPCGNAALPGESFCQVHLKR